MSKMQDKKPKISVVMPFYNAEKFLDESIQSILGQTFTDFEFVIINDASTDNSDAVVQKYLDDGRIVYIKNAKNEGIVHNLNKGIEMAKADIIARMDGDDISMSERFEKQYNFLQENKNISIVGSFAIVINEDGEYVDKMIFEIDSNDILNKVLYSGPFLHPAVCFKRQTFIAVGGYLNEYSVCQDIDLFLRMLLSGFNGYNLPEFLLKYRKHSLSTDLQYRKKAILGYKLKIKNIKKYKMYYIKSLIFVHGDVVMSFFPRKLKHAVIKHLKVIFK